MLNRKIIRSGISGLDKLTGGGLLHGSIITLSGPTGCGKSTFGMQFLIEGIKLNEPGLYISIEEDKESMYFHMSGYVWDMEKLEKEKKLVFLDYPIYEVDQFLHQNSAISEIITTLGIKRVVVDSIMPVAVFFKNADERKEGFMKLVGNIRKWDATTLIISEDTPSTTQDNLPDTNYGIETLTDGWIHLYYEHSKKEKQRVRLVEVIKMKGLKNSSRIHNARITDSGFIIDAK